MASKKNQFSKNYLILKPKDATLLDLFLFLLPFGIGFRKIRKLIDCPEGKEESYGRSFRNRWIIFISILIQKFLLAVAAPVAMLDAFLQQLVNFVSFNGGIRGLLFKLMRVELWKLQPLKTSPAYRPVVRFRDWRIEVENNTKLPDDAFRYYGALTMMASKLAYEDYSPVPSVVQSVVNGCWKMNLLGCYDFWNDFQDKATTQAFMFQNTAADPNMTIVAFRGTSPLDVYDWMVDLNISWYDIEGVGRIHSGFMQALGLQKDKGWPKELTPRPLNHDFAYYTIRQKLRDSAKSNDKARFTITGHSLGGALATLFVTVLGLHEESALLEKLEAVYTYGQPRVGDHQFAEFMVSTVRKYGFKYYRYVYSFDLVPRVPFDHILFTFKHFGGCIYFDSCYKGKFLKEQPDKNYFSLIWLMPKYLNAWWELIRSFIVPLLKGCDYSEDLDMILFRVFGLLIPGVSAHMSPNYVNSTRCGKIRVSKDDIQIETLILADYIEADY